MENGKQVELAKDEILSVTLESNPTTGYQWGVLKLDAAILRQIGEPEYTPDVPPTSGISGRGGRETFRFQAAGPGYGCLILGYRRPWEKEVEPIKTYTVQVLVR